MMFYRGMQSESDYYVTMIKNIVLLILLPHFFAFMKRNKTIRNNQNNRFYFILILKYN